MWLEESAYLPANIMLFEAEFLCKDTQLFVLQIGYDIDGEGMEAVLHVYEMHERAKPLLSHIKQNVCKENLRLLNIYCDAFVAKPLNNQGLWWFTFDMNEVIIAGRVSYFCNEEAFANDTDVLQFICNNVKKYANIWMFVKQTGV